jgi:hypothetical protein
MNTRVSWFVLTVGLLLPLADPALARAPRAGGLEAVAVSPDGKLLATGGQNRVLYLLAAPGLEVKQRLWFGARIGWLVFSRDGKRLLVEDDAETLHFLDTTTWKPVAAVKQCGMTTTAAGADLVAVRDLAFYSGTRLRLLSTADGSEKGRVDLRERVAAFSFDAAGKSLVVLTASRAGAETKVDASKVPASLEGLAREEFRQRHDGRVATLRTFALPGGKPVREVNLWYTSDSDSTTLFVDGPTTRVLNFTNACARIAADGTTTLFATGPGFNQAIGATADGKLLLAGGMREGTYGPPDGARRVKFEIDVLPGWAEYFAGFAVQRDGSAYGVTSAFRLVRIAKGGKVEKVVPVS